MQTEEMIPAEEFCLHHDIELSFIYSLKDSGLIEVSAKEEKIFLPVDELSNLEKLVRLYEMDINLEGIETIHYLLQRMKQMQDEIVQLRGEVLNYKF